MSRVTICRKCGSLDHETAACTPANVRCSKCNGTGHNAKDCEKDHPQDLPPVKVRGFVGETNIKRKAEDDAEGPDAKRPKVAAAPPFRPRRDTPATVPYGKGKGKGKGKGGKAKGAGPWEEYEGGRWDGLEPRTVQNRGQARSQGFQAERSPHRCPRPICPPNPSLCEE